MHLLCKLHEIWSTDSQESHSNCCHEMSHFKTENAVQTEIYVLKALFSIPRDRKVSKSEAIFHPPLIKK